MLRINAGNILYTGCPKFSQKRKKHLSGHSLRTVYGHTTLLRELTGVLSRDKIPVPTQQPKFTRSHGC